MFQSLLNALQTNTLNLETWSLQNKQKLTLQSKQRNMQIKQPKTNNEENTKPNKQQFHSIVNYIFYVLYVHFLKPFWQNSQTPVIFRFWDIIKSDLESWQKHIWNYLKINIYLLYEFSDCPSNLYSKHEKNRVGFSVVSSLQLGVGYSDNRVMSKLDVLTNPWLFIR